MIKFNVRGGAGNSTVPNEDVRLQDNLYLSINSKWIKDNPVPSELPWITSFDLVEKTTRERLLKDFDEFSKNEVTNVKVKNFQKAINFYTLVRDAQKRDDQGAAPVKEDLEFLINLKNLDDINQNMSQLLLNFDFPFIFEVGPDFKNSNLNVLGFTRSELVLRDTSYYGNENTDKLLAIWQKQTVELLTMVGLDKNEAKNYVKNAAAFDKKLAEVYNSAEYNAQIENLYNTMSVPDFVNRSKNLDLASFLKENDLFTAPFVIVSESNYLDHFDELFNNNNFDELKGWIVAQFINRVARYLSHDFRKASMPLITALWGTNEISSDKHFAYDELQYQFGDVVGQYYGQKYLGEEAKDSATELVESIVEVYKERLANNTWLGDETKKRALKKLDTLKLKVGYPSRVQKFYDSFEIKDSLYETVKYNRNVKIRDNYAQLKTPVDKGLWLMSAIEPNACYNPQSNDVTLPAIVLQEPFYSLNQSESSNYGGIGTVIGHEITHSFDNNGSQFDEVGDMKNWWSKEDFEKFNKRIKKEIELFDGVKVGTIKQNGKLTVSENIADQGGLTAVIEANKKANGDVRELFESYARIWQTNSKKEFLELLAASDVHALPQVRVNVQVQCQNDFYDAFDVKPTDGMWLDVDKRVQIW